MVEKVDEEIECYCQIFEKNRERVSKMNQKGAEEVALKIFEVVKDLRSKRRVQQRRGNKEAPATEKQREALLKFGVKKIPDKLTME